jgi:hypothetical protein
VRLVAGTVLPISLACAAPQLLTGQSTYRLLLTHSDIFTSPAPTPRMAQVRATTVQPQ